MMKSPKHMVVMVSWLLSALAAIHIGLCPFGISLLHSTWMVTRFAALVGPIHYLIGIAGIITLVTFVKACRCDCGKSSCSSCGHHSD